MSLEDRHLDDNADDQRRAPSSIDGARAGRDLRAGEHLVDLMGPREREHRGTDREERIVRTVGEDIPAGAQLAVGDDGRIHRDDLDTQLDDLAAGATAVDQVDHALHDDDQEERQHPATFMGFKIELDPGVPEGELEIRHREHGSVLVRLVDINTTRPAAPEFRRIQEVLHDGRGIPYANAATIRNNPRPRARPTATRDLDFAEAIAGLMNEQLAGTGVALEVVRACTTCGCTELRPCTTDGVPCGWAGESGHGFTCSKCRFYETGRG